MIIEVMSRKGRISSIQKPCFILRQDRWNDFGFQTLYQLYYDSYIEEEPTLIGDVKILRKGQTSEDTLQLQTGHITNLDESFCSIGQSLDYYERLSALGNDERDFVLLALRDIVKYPDIADSFREEAGWGTSLFRSIRETDDFIALSRTLLTRDFSALPHLNLEFTFSVPGWGNDLHFRFDNPDIDDVVTHIFRAKTEELPSRVAVIIGRNGSGKSTILARLARVAYASRQDRERTKLSSLGKITPEGLGFPRIITISYSSFDSFQIPGLSVKERRQIAKDVRNGEGRYVFCGLRDIVRELEESMPTTRSDSNKEEIHPTENKDRYDKTFLKPIEQMADEYSSLITRIDDTDRLELLVKAAKPLLADPSFNIFGINAFTYYFGNDCRERFLEWSTGHKIALHVLVSLVAHIEPRSVVLFDEPESHLHPPLLATLMHSLRIVLKKKDAFAIVATHSPVVLQETMSRHVQVIRRYGDATSCSPVDIETFGENVGLITSEVFDLTSEVTDFHSILQYIASSGRSLDEIEGLFEKGLSAQARAYVMSLRASKEGV